MPWIQVIPSKSSVAPKGTALITVIITVDAQYSFDFNRGNLDFAGVLLFRVTFGKDIYISTTGKWELSCFGENAEVLCRLSKPIKLYSRSELVDLISKIEKAPVPILEDLQFESSKPLIAKNNVFPIPKEVWQLVSFIYKYGLVLDDVFNVKSDPIICQYLRDCVVAGSSFDIEQLMTDFVTVTGSYPIITNEEMDKLQIHSTEPTFLCRGAATAVASAIETLTLLLKAGKEPIVPFAIQDQICLPDPPKDPLRLMPIANKNLFLYISNYCKQFKLNYAGRPAVTDADLCKFKLISQNLCAGLVLGRAAKMVTNGIHYG